MGIKLYLEREVSRSIPVAANVLFDKVLLLEGDIVYEIDTGMITINKLGTYVVNWFVGVEATLSTLGTVFSIRSSVGDNIIGNNCRKTGEVSGFGLIKVNSMGISIWLANAANADISTQPTVPIKAALMLFELVDGDS